MRHEKENLAMKRFGVCVVSLLLVVLHGVAPARAQDKFTMGYGGGT